MMENWHFNRGNEYSTGGTKEYLLHCHATPNLILGKFQARKAQNGLRSGRCSVPVVRPSLMVCKSQFGGAVAKVTAPPKFNCTTKVQLYWVSSAGTVEECMMLETWKNAW
ncbi:uncharacterized protein LOC125178741 [Hyalella azteca]|uniref:Uncharacterized protein LOC125178741 n=1 Tax=Hyalella azteca TaxID=294128 RepID=A0A979FQ10_HYAAZ|nr:uncharacterized protein LOC125178741 [Hyalella azteca]